MDSRIFQPYAPLGKLLTRAKPELWFLLWIGVLLLGPTIFVGEYGQGVRYVDIIAHASLEAFCGITALLIAGLLFALSLQFRQLSLALFGLAFTVMGVLDGWHAATSPREQTDLFVLLHTLSTVSGGAFMLVGIAVHFSHERAADRRRMASQFLVLSALLLAGGTMLVSTIAGWSGSLVETFPSRAMRLHELAGGLFALAAVAGFVYYRAKRQVFALLAAGLLLLFAESAYLFRFSYFWDMAWWSWHLVKMLFYIGILVVIAVGLVMSLRAVERSRRALATAHMDLRNSHIEKEVVNRELAIRNRMVNDAIDCLDLPQTLDVIGGALFNFIDVVGYELELRVPADEVPELQRRFDRQRLAWTVRAVSTDQVWEPVSDTEHPADAEPLRLVLRANDRIFGLLVARMRPGAGRCVSRPLLSDLAAEIGPIIYSALLDENRLDAIAFRTALLRVTSMLGSTSHLEEVLKRVCQESTRLLDSDAAIVFLSGDSANLVIASQCVLAERPEAAEAADIHWAESEPGRALLAQLRKTRKPVALEHTVHGVPPLRFAAETCDWGAAAVFPLFRGEALAGVMVLLRKDCVGYSQPTLDKGMLLAESVRIAINNTRTYKDLRDANQRLREAEEQKLRAERLAALGQMAASVAHEVRNPLGAIENCTAVLRSSVAGHPKACAALEIVEEEVQRLERLTGNFLAFGRPRIGEHTPANLRRIAEQAVARVRRHNTQEKVDIEVTLDAKGDSGPVYLDSDGLYEIMWNLLLNASQAIGARGRIRVSVRVRSKRAYIMVKDDGPGIEPDRRERIFEPFVSQRSHGAGLGLAIVRQLVSAARGRLRIVGSPAHGSCFVLSIPRGREVVSFKPSEPSFRDVVG